MRTVPRERWHSAVYKEGITAHLHTALGHATPFGSCPGPSSIINVQKLHTEPRFCALLTEGASEVELALT
jgi:hypothetical protein